MMDVHDKKVTVVGMGKTALALVRLLLKLGAKPYVTDSAEADKLGRRPQKLRELDVPYECGGHTPKAFAGADLVIPSPGVPPTLHPIEEAVAAGAQLTGEMEFAYAHCRSKIIAVTGTNGKTTTTELIRSMLETCGEKVTLAGNNAYPFSAAVMEEPQADYLVLEVSSYQLELAQEFRPWIGVLLNVRPDHLTRHKTLENYNEVKMRLFANQRGGDHAVFNYDDESARNLVDDSEQGPWPFSLTERMAYGFWLDGDTIMHGDDVVTDVTDVLLPGRHNLENVLAALGTICAGQFPMAAAVEALRSFQGVKHRLEHVMKIEDVVFYNDSKATNLDSVRVALQAFDEKVALIMGGQGKGEDYATLADLVEEHVTGLICIGEEAKAIYKALKKHVRVCVRAQDMDDAVLRATGSIRPQGIVLLSPGCASFDMYASFEERGEAFRESVERLAHVRRLADESLERR